MNTLFYSLITHYGEQVIAQAVSNNSPIPLKTMAIGDGNGVSVTPKATQTSLVREVYRAEITDLSQDQENQNQVIAELLIPEDVGGFTVREVGIFDENNKLIAVANCPENYKPVLEQGSGKVQYYRIVLRVSSSEAVTLSLQNNIVYATKAEVENAVQQLGRNLNKPDGFKHIGQCESIAQLRTIEPTEDQQRILLKSWQAGKNVGGGEFYADFADDTTTDNSGTVIVTEGGKRWKRANPYHLSLFDFGGLPEHSADDAVRHAEAYGQIMLQDHFKTTLIPTIDKLTGQGSLQMGNGQKVSAEAVGLKATPFLHKQLNEILIEDGLLLQGIATLIDDSQERVFVAAVTKNTESVDEKTKIYEFHLSKNGSAIQPVAASALLSIGHPNSISVEKKNNKIYILATGETRSEIDFGKSISRIEWKGNETKQAQVKEIRLFDEKSGLYNATFCLSQDSKWVIAAVHDTALDWYRYSILIYLREELERGRVNPVFNWDLTLPSVHDQDVLQGLASDGRYIYVYSGYFNALEQHLITIFDFSGNKIKEIPVSNVFSSLNEEQLLNHELGVPFAEPQGIALVGNEIYIGVFEKWFSQADIVTYNGQNYACIAKNTQGITPEYSRRWVRTNKPANKGEYNDTTLYFTSESSYSKYSNHIYSLTQDQSRLADGYSVMTANLEQRKHVEMREQYLGMQPNKLSRYSVQLRKKFNYINYSRDGLAFYDTNYGADNEKFGTLIVSYKNGSEAMFLRGNESLAKGAGINMYGTGDRTAPGQVRFYAIDTSQNNKLQTLIFRGNSPGIYFGRDNECSLGISALRFTQVYSATGSINTSDKRLKQDITAIPEEVIEAWREVNFVQYRWKAAVEEKGNARKHIGLIAQNIKQAFEKRGLNATDYGLLCYDKWEGQEEIRDEDGVIIQEAREAGDRWGIRPEECLFLEVESNRRKMRELEERLRRVER